MAIDPSELEFETNDNGEMLDEDGEQVFCQSEPCLAYATKRVAVSEEQPHDSFRNYCEACADIYYVGVQHGRFHEAALHKVEPGRDSSQDAPA